jgi:tetratricopeptide (TPR) repeat protein
MKCIASLLIVFFIFNAGLSQPVNEEALKNLLAYKDPKLIGGNEQQMLNLYTVTRLEDKKAILNIIDRFSTSSDLHLLARSLTWKGVILARPPFNQYQESRIPMQQSVTKAVQSGDKYLMVQTFESYGAHCSTFGDQEMALFYYLKSAELRRELGDENFSINNNQHFATVGNLLFQMQEYDKSIEYLQLAMHLPSKTKLRYTSALNTVALAYQRIGKYDSAYSWYNQSLQSAKEGNDTIWEAIVYGNIGAMYFEQKKYDKALPLLWKDYYTTLIKEPNSAGNTLHRIALIFSYKGKTDSALLLAKRSFEIVSSYRFINQQYLRNASYALSEVFRKTGKTDSAFYYADIYHHINDSLNQSVARNRADVAQTKLDFEKTTTNIKLLQQEKTAEKTRRQLLTAAMLILLVAGWFYFRWQKQQSKNRQQELLHQKQMAEADVINARQQLEAFTQNIISKNELIEKLQQQLQEQNLAANEELLNQTILTDNDWLRFKDMFDKANPGFMLQLKKQVPDITPAELRLATLIKLNVGNKHIASMLGTSADAVRKTKSRLRQRLQITVEDGLEDYIRSIKI